MKNFIKSTAYAGLLSSLCLPAFALQEQNSLLVPQSTSHSGNTTIAKRADEVFKKWYSWQHIMHDQDLSKLTTSLKDHFLDGLKQQYQKTAPILHSLRPFLNRVTAGHISEYGYDFRSPLQPECIENFALLYQCINSDMSAFVDVLKNSNFLTSEDAKDIVTSHDAIEKYNALINTLFFHPDDLAREQYLFTVANRFCEYCWGSQTFNEFRSMLLDKKMYPIAQMLCAVTWLNLAGNGWKLWHADSLKTLKDRADQGDQIVYIAGGSDILQLIKAGIYNIKNIDPQLPSQPKYYADDWQFIVRGSRTDGGIGDKIVFNFDNSLVLMERTEFRDLGTTFKARIATGDIIELPHSITKWRITKGDGSPLGEYVLERRFCEQTDFVKEEGKTHLMSFNELYFIALPAALNGWNIDPSRFDDNMSIVIKQLRQPVDKQMVVNMRIASLLNASDFKFIALGTCIN